MEMKPGYYVQRGAAVKSLDRIEELFSASEVDDPALLAASVTWLAVALEKRRSMALEIPAFWTVDGKEEQTFYSWDARELLSRIDLAVSVYGVAYLYKQRGRGSGTVRGLQWLSPATMQPAPNSEVAGGYSTYLRSGKTVPAEDLIVIRKNGLGESSPAPSRAYSAMSAARTLDALQKTAESIYANNALPVIMLNVPAGTPPSEMDKLKDLFWRLLNPSKRGSLLPAAPDNRVIPIRGDGAKIEKISFTPAELGLTAAENDARAAVLSALGVPHSVALSNAANYATANSDTYAFFRTMTAACNAYAEAINSDPDMQSAGIEIYAYPDRHPLERAAMLEKAQSVAALIAAGYTREAAAYLAGITPDDFPADMTIWQSEPPALPEPEPQPQPAAQPPELSPGVGKALAELATWERKTAQGRPIDAWTPAQIPLEIADAVKAGEMTFAQAHEALVVEAAIRGMELERRIRILENDKFTG